MHETIALGLVLGLIRIWMGFHVEPDIFAWSQVYKDGAHLFMGALGYALYKEKKLWQLKLFWGLIILEVVVALLSRL